MRTRKEQQRLVTAIGNDKSAEVRKFLTNGISVDEMIPVNGRDLPVSLLTYAAECGASRVVSLLIKVGARFDGGETSTPLLAAVLGGHVSIIKTLLVAGANPNQGVKYRVPGEGRGIDSNWTPLMSAVMAGKEELVTLLLEHGADPKLRTRLGLSPLLMATQQRHESIAALLREAGATFPGAALFKPIKKRDVAKVRELLQAGADPNVVGGRMDESMDGQTPLEGAVRECTTLLRTAKYELQVARHRGEEAVVQKRIEKALQEYREIIAALIDAGADVNRRAFWKSSLYMAAETGDVELVKFLLERGADPNAAESFLGRRYNDSALHAAVKGGYVDIVAALLQAGADRTKKNAQGKPAAVSARKNSEIARLLGKV